MVAVCAMQRAGDNAGGHDTANHRAGVIAMVRRGRSRSISRIKLRRRTLETLLLPGHELLCGLLVLGAHIVPRGLFLALVGAVPGRPVGVVGDVALPRHALRR